MRKGLPCVTVLLVQICQGSNDVFYAPLRIVSLLQTSRTEDTCFEHPK